MAKNRKIVLLVTKEGPHREELKPGLERDGYDVEFAAEFEGAQKVMGTLKPFVMVHDWEIGDPAPSQSFQQRIAKIAAFSATIKILLVKESSPTILATASDCNVARIVTHANARLNLASEIQMVAAAESNTADIQKTVRELQLHGKDYSQEEIDDLVEDAYRQFSHDPVVKLEFANLQFRQEDFEKSKSMAEEILRKDPHNVRCMNLISRVLMKQGDLNGAIEYLENANGLSPKNTERLSLLGKAFFTKGDLPKAERYFEEVLELEPDSDSAAKSLGEVKLSQGDINGAFDIVKNSLSEEEAASFFNNTGVIAVKNGKFDEAVSLYESALDALSSDKYRPPILFNLALAYRKKNNLTKALKCLNRALKFDTSYLKAVKQKREIERLMKKKA